MARVRFSNGKIHRRSRRRFIILYREECKLVGNRFSRNKHIFLGLYFAPGKKVVMNSPPPKLKNQLRHNRSVKLGFFSLYKRMRKMYRGCSVSIGVYRTPFAWKRAWV